jgi:hypothetical protein
VPSSSLRRSISSLFSPCCNCCWKRRNPLALPSTN